VTDTEGMWVVLNETSLFVCLVCFCVSVFLCLRVRAFISMYLCVCLNFESNAFGGTHLEGIACSHIVTVYISMYICTIQSKAMYVLYVLLCKKQSSSFVGSSMCSTLNKGNIQVHQPKSIWTH